MAHEQCGENGETICDSGEKLPFLAWSVVSFFFGRGSFLFCSLGTTMIQVSEIGIHSEFTPLVYVSIGPDQQPLFKAL